MASVIDVHVKELRQRGYQTLEKWLDASPNHVYVGRGKTNYVKGAVHSKWANPFPVKEHGLQQSLRMYTAHVCKTDLFDQLEELDGKTLGCWCITVDDGCVNTATCHAQILCRLLRYKKNGGVRPTSD